MCGSLLEYTVVIRTAVAILKKDFLARNAQQHPCVFAKDLDITKIWVVPVFLCNIQKMKQRIVFRIGISESNFEIDLDLRPIDKPPSKQRMYFL